MLGAGSTTSVLAGASLEVLFAVSCVGTAVVLFPVVRRQSETAALGYLAARLVEGGLILVGVTSLLSIITLRQDATASEPASLVTAAQMLVAVYNRAFLLSQSLMPAFSALCLGSVAVPLRPRAASHPAARPARRTPAAGLRCTAILWGSYGPQSPLAVLAALPVAVWELSLGVWLLFRGFQPAPLDTAPEVGQPAISPDSEALPSAVR